MYLAHELGSVINRLPTDFQRHIIWAFSTRAKQQDSVLCRLALYLDPRFRQAASGSATGRTEFIQKAAQFSHAQVGWWGSWWVGAIGWVGGSMCVCTHVCVGLRCVCV
jgi:hypothetical protein